MCTQKMMGFIACLFLLSAQAQGFDSGNAQQTMMTSSAKGGMKIAKMNTVARQEIEVVIFIESQQPSQSCYTVGFVKKADEAALKARVVQKIKPSQTHKNLALIKTPYFRKQK
jgi:hypothetical protein